MGNMDAGNTKGSALDAEGYRFGVAETQKAYELSYAVFRVAALMKRQDLKERLERQAAVVLEKVASGDLELGKTPEALRALIMLAQGAGEIRYINAKVLLRELGALEGVIKERLPAQEKEEEFDIEKMFSAAVEMKAGAEETIRKAQNAANQGIAALPNKKGENGNGSTKLTTSADFRGQARESAIYARIQRGNTSVKDLLAEFGTTGNGSASSPLGGVSERTLRYDLQRLVEQGKIERAGNGGPGTYYRLSAMQEGR